MTKRRRSVPAVRVLVVEDFEPIRELLRSALGKHGGLQIVGEASDGLEAVRQAEKLQPDLILLDIGLPVLNGIQAARHIRTQSPKSRVIFVTHESDAEILREALNVGVAGCVSKKNLASDLPAALDAVFEGKQFFSSGCIGELTQESWRSAF
jgi:DNA-binding NarL/FixJ family response regulator